jgi:hypothetical protein
MNMYSHFYLTLIFHIHYFCIHCNTASAQQFFNHYTLYMVITSKLLLQVLGLTKFLGLSSSVNWLLHKALVTGSELLE